MNQEHTPTHTKQNSSCPSQGCTFPVKFQNLTVVLNPYSCETFSKISCKIHLDAQIAF